MFCLPPAGSSSVINMPWKRIAIETLINIHIDIIPTKYPGHVSKSRMPLINNSDVLALEIAQTVIAYNNYVANNNPYILFKHSLRAALLCKIMRYLREESAAKGLILAVVSSRCENKYMKILQGDIN